jgi:arylformamidase
MDLAKGDPATVSRLSCGVHTGTHVDAPCHFIEHGATLDEIPLHRWLGEALIVQIDHPEAITRAELQQKITTAPSPERILFKTRNSETRWFEQPFQPNFVHLELDAAHWLIECGIKLIGIDYLSIESFHSQNAPVHKALLGANVLILEGLYLKNAGSGKVTLTCMPLHLMGADGGPARAAIRSLSEAPFAEEPFAEEPCEQLLEREPLS